MEYVYTKKGEKRAKELGVEERKAGTIAKFGHQKLEGGFIAQSWMEKGYIEPSGNGGKCNGSKCK